MLRLRLATTGNFKPSFSTRPSFQATRKSRYHFLANFPMSSTPAAAGTSVHDRNPATRVPSSPSLGFDSGPMVWVDLEMTGLDVHKDEIMEIAVLITDGNLELIHEGIQFIVKVGKERLDNMDEWCTRQHASTGLTQACLDSPHTLFSVESAVLDYVQKYIPEKRIGVLAGNSVHVDRMFLAEQMPRFVEHLHYRIVDVSSIKELCRRWYNGAVAPPMVAEENAHRALDDIQASIKELQWYREHIFVKPESLSLPTS